MTKILNRASTFGGELGNMAGQNLARSLDSLLQTKLKALQENNPSIDNQQQDSSSVDALNSAAQQPQQANPKGLDVLSMVQKIPEFQEALKSMGSQPQPQEQQALQKPEAPKTTKPTSFPKNSSKLSTKQVDKILNSAGPKTPEPVQKAEEIVEQNPDPIKHAKVVDKQDKKIKELPKLSEKQQLAADKETKESFDEISKGARGAKDGNVRLDRMIELIKGGNLSWPSAASFLDTIAKGIPIPLAGNLGLDLHFVESKDTHEFRKLTSDFIKGAKDVFGGRVTNLDLESFMKTIPNVTQSDEGKIAVIRNMRLFNSANLARKKAMDEIIELNGGERPRNLSKLIEDRASDQLDALAEEFKKGILTKDESEALANARDRKILGIF